MSFVTTAAMRAGLTLMRAPGAAIAPASAVNGVGGATCPSATGVTVAPATAVATGAGVEGSVALGNAKTATAPAAAVAAPAHMNHAVHRRGADSLAILVRTPAANEGD